MNRHLRYYTVAVILVIVALLALYAQAPQLQKQPAVPQPEGSLSHVYTSPSGGFSIRYPEGFASETLEPRDAMIGGVKLKIPAEMAAGTNLSPDSYVSVEVWGSNPKSAQCVAFLEQSKSLTIKDGSVVYSVASSTGAAAGNRYDEAIYALFGTNPCISVHYYTHYMVYENYPEGAVRRFDEQALRAQFDAIRRSLVVVQ